MRRHTGVAPMPDPIQGVNSGDVVIIGSTSQAAASPAAGPVDPVAPTGSADSADVGQTQALLHTIATAAEEVSTVDQNRIAELQQAIAAGTYQPDPQAIAQKLIETESVLGPNGAAA